jgi:hypothetical protein
MTATILPQDWLHFIEQEYLSSFVAEGGSSIKFAVPQDDARRCDILEGLSQMALRSGYLVATIDDAETKVNKVEEIFFRTAQQIPWRTLSLRILQKLAADSGYSWMENPEEPLYRVLAAHNRVDPQLLLLDLKKAVGDKVFNRTGLSRDFRVAMTHLCFAELSGGQDGLTTTGILIDWLTGQNRAASAVKAFQIFRKINRNTARFFFQSMLHWVRFAGYAGTAITLDLRRTMVTKNVRDGSIFYTKAAVLDTYEILRQFIDLGDQMEACFFTVVSDPGFLEDPSRGIGAYEALKFRVFDEIRDKGLVNPMAALARIATPLPTGAEGAAGV